MSAIPVNEAPEAVAAQARPAGFWQHLVRALDRYFVDRTKRAVPAVTLRRSKREIDRCRRLLHKNAMAPVKAPANREARDR